MPHVSSIFPKLVSAVTIVMASSDANRNATKCEFIHQNKMCSSILGRCMLDASAFNLREYVLDQTMLK